MHLLPVSQLVHAVIGLQEVEGVGRRRQSPGTVCHTTVHIAAKHQGGLARQSVEPNGKVPVSVPRGRSPVPSVCGA